MTWGSVARTFDRRLGRGVGASTGSTGDSSRRSISRAAAAMMLQAAADANDACRIGDSVARLLGGEIRVASVHGKGSTFTLYLPLDFPPSGDAAGAPAGKKQESPESLLAPVSNDDARAMAPQAREALAGRKVLVVDDDIRNVFAMTSALEMHGMTVLHADSGREAVETLKREGNVDLVLMDVMMPGLDGLDTIRMVRTLEGYAGVPIIAVTAKAMQGDREKCLDAGASAYLAKPVNVDVLLATLAKAVHVVS